jgi:hypothetical protein
MASLIHRGRRFDFDDALCPGHDTEDTLGQFAKCPICAPERYVDPDRLLDWLLTAAAEGHFARWHHVYEVAFSWLDPGPLERLPTPRQRMILSDLRGPEWWRHVKRYDPEAPKREHILTVEASRAWLNHGVSV